MEVAFSSSFKKAFAKRIKALRQNRNSGCELKYLQQILSMPG
jgi:hypothetical protein